MFSSKWIWRFLLSVIVSIICLFLSLTKTDYILNYMNLIFLVGLDLLIISATTFVIISGFFNVFAKGVILFFKRNTKEYKLDERDEERLYIKKEQRNKILLELFLYSPLTVSIVLIAQSLILLFFI